MKKGDYVVRSVTAPAHALTTYQVIDRHGDIVHVTFMRGVVEPEWFDAVIRHRVARHEERKVRLP